jgi:ABC-2 type transport system ATP-binding protein
MSTPREIEIGEVRASGISRVFEIQVVKARSLKEAILRRQLPPKRQIWALRDVDVHIRPGEAYGIVGQNGSGKSTLLKLFAGIFAPSSGTLEVGGRVGSLIELGAGFHPEFTGTENVYLSAAIHGIPRAYVDKHLEEIIGFAELEDFADMPVKTYSSGMFMRLGFSVAMHVNPDILLLDEVLAVGDEAFQQKCYGKIWDFKRAGGTIVFVSHSAAAVEQICERALLLDHGRVMEEGTADEVLRAYHRRLVLQGQLGGVARRGDGRAPVACRIHDVQALGPDGSTRTGFVEREPLTVEIQLFADKGLTGSQVEVGFREASGRVIGNQTATGVDLRPERLEAIRLHLAEPPLREGRFFVDVRVLSHDGDAELALLERALELNIFAQDPAAGGPIRLGGRWELPAETSQVVAEAAER